MSDDYRLQLSIKIDGQHLFNIRGCNTEEFLKYVKEAVEYVELLQTATRALEGKTPPAPAQGTRQASIVSQKSTSGEIGPVLVEGVATTPTATGGTRYAVKLAGKSYSTFKDLIGQAAMTLSGKQCYFTTETKGTFTNLASIRSA